MIRVVDFALKTATVRLVTTFVYRRSLVQRGGRVYVAEDVKTGRRDIVGAEYLKPSNVKIQRSPRQKARP